MARALEDRVLSVRNLQKSFPVKKDFWGKAKLSLRAVNGLNFDIYQGECLSLVGESGCGKSSTARLIARLIEADSGEVVFKGQNLLKLNNQALNQARINLQMVFQNPYSSLDPRYKIGESIAEPLEIHWKSLKKDLEKKSSLVIDENPPERGDEKSPVLMIPAPKSQKIRKKSKVKIIKQHINKKQFIRKRINELLSLVELDEGIAEKYPHECSGGQNQRVGIARAIALNPDLIIADEAVSALDVSVQWKVLHLLKKIQKELNISFLFIAHNLGIVRYMSDRVAVMYLGEIVEIGDTEELFTNPLHPYTRALINSAPIADPNLRDRERVFLSGEIPKPTDIPSGCPFHTRCPMSAEICSQTKPKLEYKALQADRDHLVACLLVD